MDEAAWDRLVSDIYAAATDAENWGALAARLASLFSASMCTLWSFDAASGRPEGLLATTFPSEAMRDYAEHFFVSDPWRAAEHRAGWDVATPGLALVEDRVLAATGYYTDFGSRHDTFHLMASRHRLSGRDAGILSKVAFCRPRNMAMFSAAEFGLLDRLIPHLRRAWQMRHQIDAAGARSTRSAWEDGIASALLSLPGAVLTVDGLGRVHFANAAAERLGLRRGPAPTGRNVEAFLRPGTLAERTRLRRALADAVDGGAGDAFLLGAGTEAAQRVVVTPLPARGVPTRLALVLITPMTIGEDAATVEGAMRATGLTRAEADVTFALARGLSPQRIAETRGVRITTVRTLLVRAQAKLGVQDLRGLVVAATLLRGA